MKEKFKVSRKTIIGICIGVFIATALVSVVCLAKFILKHDGGNKKRHICMVKLMRPPPPPKIQKKPPEPEIKEEKVIEPEPQEQPEETEQTDNESPPGDELGLDADGTAGSDGFGLKAKKGGRSLLAGDFGNESLLRKYSWYTRIIKNALRKRIEKLLKEDDDFPEGEFEAGVTIALDRKGIVVDFNIYKSSGNETWDKTVEQAMKFARISEPPPAGMPKTIKLKINSKG